MTESAQQQALRALSGWAQVHQAGWLLSSEFETVLRATFARATKTYNAGVLLTGGGYGPQAAMLARSLFEDMLLAYWMVYVRPEAWTVARIKEWREFNRLLMHSLAHKQGFGVEPHQDISPDQLRQLEEDRPRFEATFGRYAEASWWMKDVDECERGGKIHWNATRKRSLLSLIRELEATPRGDAARYDDVVGDTLQDGIGSLPRKVYDIAHNFNNLLLHHSAVAIELHLFGTSGGDSNTWNEEPSQQWLPQSQLVLFWSFGQLIILMCQRLDPSLASEAHGLFADKLSILGQPA